MNTVVPISQHDDRLETASRWVLALDEGLSPSGCEELKTWLAEDPQNVSEFLEVAKVWDKTEDLKRLADLFPAGLFSHEQVGRDRASPAHRSRSGFGLGGIAAAASLVLVVAAGFWLLLRLNIDPTSAGSKQLAEAQSVLNYETAVGRQSSAILPDGSKMVLNTNSRVQVVYSESARVLLLHRGEIHIEVTEDITRPLSVVAGDRIVQAVGTSFSVEITDQQHVEVVVTDGKVVVGISPADIRANVESSTDDTIFGHFSIAIPPVLAQSDTNTVNAGEELVLGTVDDVAVPVPVSADEIEVKLSWREGRLVFRSEPLEKALREVERYTTVEFVFLDEELKTRSMTGRYRAGDVDALLLALRANFNITHEYESENRVLLSSL